MNVNDRTYLFLGVCLTVRTLITYLAMRFPDVAAVFAPAALIPGIGFLYTYIAHMYNGGVGYFGGKVWWHDLRLTHAALWTTFALSSDPSKWKYLAADTAIGLIGWFMKGPHN